MWLFWQIVQSEGETWHDHQNDEYKDMQTYEDKDKGINNWRKK